MTEAQRIALADAIVADLFQNGSGDVADRLVLTRTAAYLNGWQQNLGGWAKLPARNRILKIIDNALENAGRAAAEEGPGATGGTETTAQATQEILS